jgi:aspartate/tyrosine/aromatic aminotransferase
MTLRRQRDSPVFDALKPQPQDKILSLMQTFRDDPREGKIDLGVGVYKDATGLTPVMRAVKTAERQLWETERTKTYTGLAGDPDFNAAMVDLILGRGFADRAASVATPGGTGAIRQAFEMFRMAAPEKRIWMSGPTWPNHPSIARHLGIGMAEYAYLDRETGGVAFDDMMADLTQARPGDMVLLHGCCHNPTGANLSPPQWQVVAERIERRGLIPLIDLAYQGFGDGLDADAAATRMIAAKCPEVLIAASCSKNFGIYRERTGVLIALTDPARRGVVQGNLAYLNRQNFSFPPDHGARLVTMILTDPVLRADWEAELEGMRRSMLSLREALATELRNLSGSDRFGFLAAHRGMFSRLGASEAQVERLRTEHGIYIVSDSRLNIAGLNAATVPVLAQAILAAGI